MSIEATESSAHEPSTTISNLLDNASKIGGIYDMTYESCKITTNDFRINEVDGLPQTAYLLATPTDDTTNSDDDTPILLLRVTGTADLPDEQELEFLRENVARTNTPGTDTYTHPVDVHTQAEMQRTAYTADILGTFYTDTDGTLTFGNDAESIYAAGDYTVYKPSTETLARIASYPLHPGRDDGVRLGRVRYTSAEHTPIPDDATVNVDITDFIGSKTGLFGMTRTGKSNAMKIIAAATAEHAATTDTTVGQLLFDPSGEYANANQQDERALGELDTDHVTIYSWNTSTSGPRHSLKLNFFDEDTIRPVWGIIKSTLTRDADYVRSFKQANVIGPDRRQQNYSAYTRAEWCRSALYATLIKAGFAAPSGTLSTPQVRGELVEFIEDETGEDIPTTQNGNPRLDADNIVPFWETIAENPDDVDDIKDGMIDADLDAVLDMLTASRGSGYRLLQPLRVYHDPARGSDFAADIYSDLEAGRIVIIDVSTGPQEAIQYVSERILRRLLEENISTFRAGDTCPNVQVYLEEAHRFFGREYIETNEDDPYVRLAREGAKYDIGLIYATQQVSSVDHQILSETANWIVTHLNNTHETKTLSKHYEFDAFDRLIRQAQDVGFARMITDSGRYIVPLQFDLFDEARVTRLEHLLVD